MGNTDGIVLVYTTPIIVQREDTPPVVSATPRVPTPVTPAADVSTPRLSVTTEAASKPISRAASPSPALAPKTSPEEKDKPITYETNQRIPLVGLVEEAAANSASARASTTSTSPSTQGASGLSNTPPLSVEKLPKPAPLPS